MAVSLHKDAASTARLITGNEFPPVGPVKNCAGCGLILTLGAFAAQSRCPHCDRPLAMHDAKRRAAEGEDLEGLRKAVELRNRLLEYDKQAANLTHVVDDDKAGADYSQWDTEEERAIALETLRAEETKAREDARRRVLALDLGMDRLAPTLSGAPLRMFQVLQRDGAGS